MTRIKHVNKLTREESKQASLKDDSNALYPHFDLSRVNLGHFPLRKCTNEEKAAFADKLSELSLLTWQQLTQAPRHGAGFEKIQDYPRPANLPEDVSILAFRFCGIAAMLGFRINRVFTVIDLDRSFKAYKHA